MMKKLLFIPLIFLVLSCEDKQESIDNNVPVANDISIVTDENVPMDITLTGFDTEGSELIFEVIADPLHGILSGELPSITYTPNANFSGNDSFTYHVFDGINYSAVATVTITILPISLGGLYINEFMAINNNNIQDESGGYGDWIEIYNSTNESVNLGGMFLTDSLSSPVRYQIPNGITIDPMGFLLFWADDDEEDGDLHTNFNLSGFGEEIGLFDMDGITVIDSITFSEQSADISFGRVSDGNTSWVSFTTPTPNSSNGN